MVLEGLKSSFEMFVSDIVVFLPRLAAGVLFLIFSYFGIKMVLSLLRPGLESKYQDELLTGIITSVVAVFLWFTAVLVLLSILGMGEIAASLGTATGFVALGVAYALSDMIADTVSGYYLIRDQDFQAGDRIKSGEFEGTVAEIGIRKTKLTLEDGDTAVISNSKIEKEWIKRNG